MNCYLIKYPAWLKALAISKAKLYELIADGTVPPGTKLGKRDNVWANHEPTAIAAAILRGFDDDQLRQVSQALVLARRQPELLRDGVLAELLQVA